MASTGFTPPGRRPPVVSNLFTRQDTTPTDTTETASGSRRSRWGFPVLASKALAAPHEAWIQCGFWGHLRCGLGRIANSSATIGDDWNATRLHSRLFPPNGGRFGSVVAGGRDRVPGALFPFFLSIFLTTRMECSAALFLIARRSDEVRGRAGPRGVDCIVDAEWTTDVRWRLSGPPTGGWREPSARERKLRNAMPRLGRVWRSMPRGTAVNLQPWSVEC